MVTNKTIVLCGRFKHCHAATITPWATLYWGSIHQAPIWCNSELVLKCALKTVKEGMSRNKAFLWFVGFLCQQKWTIWTDEWHTSAISSTEESLLHKCVCVHLWAATFTFVKKSLLKASLFVPLGRKITDDLLTSQLLGCKWRRLLKAVNFSLKSDVSPHLT